MNVKIMCLVVSGLPLTDAALDCLYRAAITLVKNKKAEMKFCHDDVYGIITTDYQMAQLADASGYVFEAEITTEEGSSTAKYIVRNSDIQNGKVERGFWVHPKIIQPKEGSLNKKTTIKLERRVQGCTQDDDSRNLAKLFLLNRFKKKAFQISHRMKFLRSNSMWIRTFLYSQQRQNQQLSFPEDREAKKKALGNKLPSVN